MQRRRVVFAGVSDAGTGVDQELGDGDTVRRRGRRLAGEPQRRIAFVISGIHVGTALDQQLNHFSAGGPCR